MVKIEGTMAVKLSRCFYWLIALVVIIPCLLCPPALAAQPPQPPQPPPKVTIAVGDDYAPFFFNDGKGQPTGWLVDIWKLWSQKTGIAVSFKAVAFSETLRMVKDGEADIQGGCFFNEERAKYLDYVAPLAKTTTSFFFHKGISGIRNVVDLEPFRIGVIKGDYSVSYLREKLPEVSLAEFETNDELFTALKTGEIRVFVADTPIGLYFLEQWDLLYSFSFLPNRPLYSAVYRAAVQKGSAVWAKMVKQGMEQITPAERLAIERRWSGSILRKKKDVLLIACERDDQPLATLTASGRPSGILVDIWRLWAAKTKHQIEFVFGSRAETVDWVRKGRADIHSGLVREPYLDRWLDFSMSLFSINTGIFYRAQDGPIAPSGLSGHTVGVLKDSFVIGVLAKRCPGIVFDSAASMEQLGHMLYRGEVRAVVDVAVSFKDTLDHMGYSGEIKWDGKPLSVQVLSAGITKHKPKLLELVNQGLADISRQEILAIEKRWVPDESMQHFSKTGIKFELNDSEKKWLADHQEIRLGIDPSWLPFEAVGQDDEYVGISSDYVKLLGQKLGVHMNPKEGLSWTEVMEQAKDRQIDVLPCVSVTPERRKYLAFTRPYISFTNVVLTRADLPFISGLKSLKGKKLAVTKGYAIAEILKIDHPDLDLLPVDNIEEGFAAVRGGQAAGFIDNLASVNYMMNKTGATDLKIALTTKYKSQLALGVRRDWPELVGILGKALLSISETQAEKIANRWANVRFQRTTNWGVILQVGGAALGVIAIILSVIIMWNRRMAKEVAQRQAAEERFQTMAANVPGAIFQLQVHADGQRQYLYLSQRCQEFFGVGPEVVIAEGRLLAFHPKENDRIKEEIRQSLIQKAAINIVGRITLPSGKTKWVRLSAFPSQASEGELIYNGFILDITERKLAELEYLASERKVKAMSQAVEDALVMIDSQGKVVFWNPAAEKLFGYSEAEALGHDFHAMGAPEIYHEKIRPGLQDFAQSGQGAVLGVTTEITAHNRKGRQFPVEVTLASFQIDEEWFAVGTVRDISERKQAEDRLKLTQNTVDKAAQSIFWADPDTGGLTYVNEAACKSLGYSKDELLGMNVMDVDVNFDQRKFEALMQLLQETSSIETEGVHRTKDGRRINVMLSIVLTQFQDRQILGIYAKDITDLKKAQEAVRESENYMKKILGTSRDGFWFLDNHGVTRDVNQAMCNILGRSRAQVVGKHAFDFYDQDNLKILKRQLELREMLEESAYEISVSRPDGSQVPCLFNATPFLDENEEKIGSFAMVSDITEQKKAAQAIKDSEERSRLILESAGEGIFGVNADGQMTFINPAATKMLGFAPHELMGQKIHGLIHHHCADGSEYLVEDCPMHASYSKGQTNHIDDEVLWRKDGGSFPVEYASTPIFKQGEVVGAVVTFRDITERLEAERERDDAYEIIASSINYATNIQRSMLPSKEAVIQAVPKNFVLWEPRDGVGGDVYFCKPWGLGKMLALGDCTGHGVPGAFMTLIANGALDMVSMETMPGDVATLLTQTHSWIQSDLRQDQEDGKSDDGLEMGVCYLMPGSNHMIFAGARFSLFYMEGGQVFEIKGDKKGLGYRGIPKDVTFNNHKVEIKPGRNFFMTSDGLLDQIGGEKRRGFGKKRFKRLLQRIEDVPMEQKGALIYQALMDYQGDEKRRDDVSVMGFSFE